MGFRVARNERFVQQKIVRSHKERSQTMKTLYTGKTKNVMLDEETNIVSLFFKDSMTG